MAKVIEVQVNDRGRRIGQSHPRSKLTDHDIDLIRELAEELAPNGKVTKAVAYEFARRYGVMAEGRPSHVLHRVIAKKFDINERTARKIVTCERRAQTAAKAKRVKVAA